MLRLKDGDQLLLCTDGLTDMVTEETITGALAQERNSAQICEALIEMALEAGGNDNITVALARYQFS